VFMMEKEEEERVVVEDDNMMTRMGKPMAPHRGMSSLKAESPPHAALVGESLQRFSHAT
jgi:hypothetical protein